MLYLRPEWVSAKSLIPNGLITAQEFFLERQTLAHDQLNLSAWNGPNEVFWNIKKNWSELELKASLAPDAYLWIFIDQQPQHRFAFRLSRNKKFNSGFFELNAEREFLKKEYFDPEINDSGFQTISVSKANGSFVLAVNGITMFKKKLAGSEPPLISFRSSMHSVILDDVKIITDNGMIVENFSPHSTGAIIFLSLGFGLLILLCGVLLFRRSPFAEFKIFSLQISIFLILLGYSFLDRQIWSSHYYYHGYTGASADDGAEFKVALESARQHLFGGVFQLLRDERRGLALTKKNYAYKFFIPENTNDMPPRAKEIYFSNGLEDNSDRIRRKLITRSGGVELLSTYSELTSRKDNSYKIAFMGSSQTFGGGAQSFEKAFPSKIIAALNSCGGAFTGLNFSAPGENSAQLLQTYKDILPFWKPDLLVVNLGHNDRDLTLFRTSLKNLLDLNAKLNIKTVFIKEPNTIELNSNPLLERHQILEELSQLHHLKIFDLNAYLASGPVYDSGLIWWDIVHLDQAGHNATAKWLTELLKTLNYFKCKK